MTYESNAELPEQVTNNLPEHGQDIYREAYNNAWDQYADPADREGDASREETAHKVAWNAVEQEYEKRGDDWVRKES